MAILEDNQLTGSIPASLGTLPQLTTLYLHFNHLTGEFPPVTVPIGINLEADVSYNDLDFSLGSQSLANVTLANAVGANIKYLPQGSLIAASGDLIGPTPSEKLLAAGSPAVDSAGDVAFRAILSGTGKPTAITTAILLYSGTTVTVVASTGDMALDSTGVEVGQFARFADPVLNNNGAVAFIADLAPRMDGVTARDQSGLWSNASGTLVNIAREASAAPGGGAFSSFNEIVLPDTGDLVFEATLSGEPPSRNEGVWALWNGALTRVIGKGDSLDLHAPAKTVKSLGIFQLVPTALGQSRSFDATTGNLVFEATFTDGTWGIYEATAP